MDATLAQILNHVYDLEVENQTLKEFLTKNRGVLLAANEHVPGLDGPQPEPPANG